MDKNYEELEKIRIVQRCPKCGKLSLHYSEGKLMCSNCAFSQDAGSVNEN